MADFTLENLEQFLAKLKQSAERIDARGEELLDNRANEMLSLTRRAAPVRSGRLRDSYQVRRVATKDHVAAREVFSDLDYAPPVELGTIHMAAQPHLGPSYETASSNLLDDLQTKLLEGI